jgi:hypothetical protein
MQDIKTLIEWTAANMLSTVQQYVTVWAPVVAHIFPT